MTEPSRPVVVTGASRGLGAAMARHFARLGHDVALCARSAGIEELAAELHAETGVRALGQPLDVGDEAAVRAFATRVVRELGPSCAVVNNAAVLGPVGPIDQLDLSAWREALEVNVFGVAVVTAAFVPQLVAGGGGVVVNLSGGGIGGAGTHSNISAYTTSKGAVAALTESLSKELSSRGVRVNALAPGAQPTGFMDAVLDAAPGDTEPGLRDLAASLRVPDGAAVLELDPSLADLLSFLVSDESAWLTGKLVSARWDSVASLTASRARLERSSLLNLRRIDDALFSESAPQ